MPLNGFEDEGDDQAKAASLHTGFPALAAVQTARDLSQRQVHRRFFLRMSKEVREVPLVSEPLGQVLDQAILFRRRVDFRKRQIEAWTGVEDSVRLEGEIG